MASELSPLFVRLPAADARHLDMAAAASGKSKRHLVSEAVREHLTEEGLVVGRASIRESDDEVMTAVEVAALLRLDEADVLSAAQDSEIPGRLIAGSWRFSRSAVIAWLAAGESGRRQPAVTSAARPTRTFTESLWGTPESS